MKSFTVEKNQKLTKYLLDKYGAELSFSTLQKLLRNKDIKVNGKRINKDLDVVFGDKIDVYYDGAEAKLDLVYENGDIFVFNKPQTITSEDFETLVNKTYNGLKLCHRLDRNTQGLLIFSKESSLEEMLNAFKNKTIKKYYITEVYGKLKEPEGTLTAYLKKDSDNSLVKIFSNQVPGSVKIITKYKVLEERENSTLIEVNLITGKTHQIRAHFSHIGHFVIGDNKYGDTKINKLFGAKRQRLVSYKIIFSFDSDSKLYYLNNEQVELKNIKF